MRWITVVCAFMMTATYGYSGQAADGKAGGQRKALIVYYSPTNNTRTMAQFIQEHSGFDIEEIELVQPYTAHYEELVDQTRDELRRGYLPPIRPLKADLSDYDMVLVGSPLWIYTLSLPVMSFLIEYDLAGKTVVPFCTRGTSSAGPVFDKVAELCPQSRVLSGFDITRDGFYDARPALRQWVAALVAGLEKGL